METLDGLFHGMTLVPMLKGWDDQNNWLRSQVMNQHIISTRKLDYFAVSISFNFKQNKKKQITCLLALHLV